MLSRIQKLPRQNRRVSTRFRPSFLKNSSVPKPRIAILVGGGPAPGINGVIRAATIQAQLNGADVLGIKNGLKNIMVGDLDHTVPLSIADVSRIHLEGGSILRISRANPTQGDRNHTGFTVGEINTFNSLKKLGVDALIAIGGDDTAYSASRIHAYAQHMGQSIRIALVPKTVDNDLPLPENKPTFGFESARHYGTEIIAGLMNDAQTTNRWFFVTTMGRHTGHLALGIGRAAGATLTLIPEEFHARGNLEDLSQPVTLKHLADLLELSIIKRRIMDRPYGVAVIAEGLAARLDPLELKATMADGVELDDHGHVRLSKINIGRILQAEVNRRFEKRDDSVTINFTSLGYSFRSRSPIPFDLDYTFTLGTYAVDFILNPKADGPMAAMICVEKDRLRPLAFDEFMDPKTGRPRTRFVDMRSDSYRVARDFMIRPNRQDGQDPQRIRDFAKAMNMTPQGFESRFQYLLG